MKLRYSVIFVKDVEATAKFYVDAFGLAIRFMHPSKGFAEMATGETLLAFLGEDFIHDQKLLAGIAFVPNVPSGNPVGAQIAFVSEDLDRDWHRAIDAGCAVLKALETKPWGQTAGYFRDLNGFIVELASPNPRDTA